MFQRTQRKYKSTACARSSARQSNNNDYDWYCIPWIYGVDRFMRHIGNKSKINYVLLALSPAILMLIYQFGWSVLVNLSIAITSTLCLELIIVTLSQAENKIFTNIFINFDWHLHCHRTSSIGILVGNYLCHTDRNHHEKCLWNRC